MNMHITSERRKEIERQIDELIEMLDILDGDENLEEYGDEHDTGLPEGWRLSGVLSDCRGPILEDDEDGNDLEQDNADTEPALGWTNHIDQTIAPIVHAGGTGPVTGEDEPSLGWSGHGTGWQPADGHCDDEPDGDEGDTNGGEIDYSGYQEEAIGSAGDFDGSGERIAIDMLRKAGIALRQREPVSVSCPTGSML
jgi:hypothetical protein